jgi:hypothetical protein
VPDPALEDEDVEEPEGVAADFFALAVAFGPSAGSFPFAIWAASSPPMISVAATASAVNLAISTLVDCLARLLYLR